MTQPQYLRKVSVVVASETQRWDFAQFRCKFTVRKGDMQTPNSCDVRIYNLSKGTARQLAPVTSEFQTLTVSAGYENGNYGQIFTGKICQVRMGRESQVDTYVDITAADGDDAYNFATVSASMAVGHPGSIAAVLQNAMKVYGINQPPIPQFLQDKPADRTRGYVMYGLVKDELRLLCQNNDCVWSIQDGTLQFVDMTQLPYDQAIVLGPSSGLIGTPEQTQSGIAMRTLLNPAIKVCSLIKLEAEVNLMRYGLDLDSQATNPTLAAQNNVNANGYYYVMNVGHDGDTRGTEWYSDLVCLAVDAQLDPKHIDLTGNLIAGPVPAVRY